MLPTWPSPFSLGMARTTQMCPTRPRRERRHFMPSQSLLPNSQGHDGDSAAQIRPECPNARLSNGPFHMCCRNKPCSAIVTVFGAVLIFPLKKYNYCFLPSPGAVNGGAHLLTIRSIDANIRPNTLHFRIGRAGAVSKLIIKCW